MQYLLPGIVGKYLGDQLATGPKYNLGISFEVTTSVLAAAMVSIDGKFNVINKRYGVSIGYGRWNEWELNFST